jgi:hypothetical protein
MTLKRLASPTGLRSQTQSYEPTLSFVAVVISGDFGGQKVQI